MVLFHHSIRGVRKSFRLRYFVLLGSMTAAIFSIGSALRAAPGSPYGASDWQRSHRSGSVGGNAAAGQKIAQTQCAACHGPNGNSSAPQFPKLSGQDLDYTYWQLRAFKAGSRHSDAMQALVSNLSYADMANVAAFYARQTCQADPVRDRRLAAAGEQIFYNGMPACAMCHERGYRGGMRGGMMGDGMMMGGGMMGTRMGSVPNLNGQHAVYIADQLARFAHGERAGSVMNRFAASLHEGDRGAVAEFLATRR